MELDVGGETEEEEEDEVALAKKHNKAMMLDRSFSSDADSTNNKLVGVKDELVTVKTENTSGDSLLPSPEEKKIDALPAWVFCTRYSDRPSSGEPSQIFSQKLSCYKRFFFLFKINIIKINGRSITLKLL
jgi:hypothetical protein